MKDTEAALGELAAGKYLLLTTFRRDGTAVPTPVWVMRDGKRWRCGARQTQAR